MSGNTLFGLIVVSLALFAATQAEAFVLTNYDTARYEFTMKEGDTTSEMTLEAEQTMTDLCEDGCTITLQNGEWGRYDGHESVYIQDGKLYVAEESDE